MKIVLTIYYIIGLSWLLFLYSCLPVKATTKKPTQKAKEVTEKKYSITKIKQRGVGVLVKLQGTKGYWYLPVDTFSVGDTVTIIYYR